MSKKIYYITGLGGSGKTTVAQKIADELKIPLIHADSAYALVMSKLGLTREQVAPLATVEAWRNHKDWGIYKTPEKLLETCYNELFSYLPPEQLVLEGYGLFVNPKEFALVNEYFKDYEKRFIVIEPDYETWLRFRSIRRSQSGEVMTRFLDEDEFYHRQESFRHFVPEKHRLILKNTNIECSGTGGKSYQSEEFSDPKWEIYQKHLGDLRGKKLFEISCNSGWFSEKARRAGAMVDGLDISWQVLDKAMERVPDGNFHLSKIEDFEFEEVYDIVLCSSAFHYYHHREEQIAKISRVCRTFLLELPVNNSEGEDIYYQGGEDGFFCSVPSKDLIEKWLKKYFKSVELVDYTDQPNSNPRPVYLCQQ